MVVPSLHCGDGADIGLQVEKKSEVKSPAIKADEAVVSSRRRVSARLQTNTQRAEEELVRKRAEKEELVRKRVELLDDKDCQSKKVSRRRVHGDSELVDEKKKEVGEVVGLSKEKTGDEIVVGNLGGQNGGIGGGDEGGLGAVGEKSVYARVKDTLRLFNKHYLYFVQQEETRCAKAEVDKKQESKKSKKPKKPKKPKTSKESNVIEVEAKRKAKRPDLKAITKMADSKAIMYPQKRIGDLPGINVGHQFYSRAEMVVIGFHSHWLNGIDYMGLNYSKDYGNYTFPLAVAIVLSGMYEDDLDNAEDVVYTGQGGHNLRGNKRQIRDQKMERGNLALKNCVEQLVPVRVIRGHECASSYCGKVYTYDGLYKVVQYWAEKGISGFTVFKIRLRRLEGQPTLSTNQVQFVYGRVPESVSEIRGLVCEDISGGEENIPIPATNLVDDPPVPPTGFTYRKAIQLAKNIKLPANVTGCSCEGDCVNPLTCACARLNGSDFPYVHRNGGRLIEARPIVYECGPNCGCGPNCVNRTSQGGPKYRLEIFRTPKKGWAVRSWDFIPSGAPICEYVGVLIRTDDMDSVCENNNFIFEIDCLQTMRGLGGREQRRLGNVSVDSVPIISNMDGLDDQKSENVPEFCIDAGSTGNIARFINHSCEPNLFVQCVLSSHHDLRLARVMLFAADNIPPLQELTYDYGYALDSVHGPDGKVKKMACFCGTAGCRKRLF